VRRNYTTKRPAKQVKIDANGQPVRSKPGTFERELHFTVADIEAYSKRRDEMMSQLDVYDDVLFA
jgi:hypothetical protein